MICDREKGIMRTSPSKQKFLRCSACGKEWPMVGSDVKLPRHTRSDK